MRHEALADPHGPTLYPPPPLQDFREPLYLLDKPVWLEDDRSEEERRYPELFRAKLEAAGWHVAPSVSTVPIPGERGQAGAAGQQLRRPTNGGLDAPHPAGYNMPLTQDYRTL